MVPMPEFTLLEIEKLVELPVRCCKNNKIRLQLVQILQQPTVLLLNNMLNHFD